MKDIGSSQIIKLYIASLLHDIGKFHQRTGERHSQKFENLTKDDFGYYGAHSKWSAEFVEKYYDEEIADLVLYHHAPNNANNKSLAKIIQEADHLSSAVDRTERSDIGEVDKEKLKSVFPAIRLSDKEREVEVFDKYHNLGKLEISENVFPGKRDEEYVWKLDPIYKNLWKEFTTEFEQINDKFSIVTLLHILRKYTAYIPSAAYKHEPDIPLFDHLKTTAAISSCLYLSDQERPFLVVQGDLSGIQDFIFNIASPQDARKGMAKRLRGRSFWLSLLSDAVATHLTREMGLYEGNILWNTGGNFLIIAPNTNKIKNKIHEVRKKVNQALLDRFKGRIFIALDFVECSKEELRSFPSVHEESKHQINIQKRRKFIDCNISFKATGENLGIEYYCSVCGTPVEKPRERCGMCNTHEKLGQKLAKANYMVKGSGNLFEFDFSSLGLDVSYDILPASVEVSKYPAEVVYTINSTDFLTETEASCGFIFLGNTVPATEKLGRVFSFDEIAQLSKGAKKIGVLKTDVDDLGKIFAFGLDEKFRSISRIHSLSSNFEIFFAGYLNRICQKYTIYSDLCEDCKSKSVKRIVYTLDGEEIPLYEAEEVCEDCETHGIPKLYILFSGGDDLLIFGPYDSVIEVASEIQAEFKKYTACNPELSISSGLDVIDPHLPVSRSIEHVEEKLSLSKAYGKNRISLFDESLPWSDNGLEKGFSELLSTGKELEGLVENKNRKLSKSFIYSMLKLWRSTYGDLAEEPFHRKVKARNQRKRYLPKLKYILARNVENDDRDEVERLISKDFPWIKFPIYWVSLRCRR